MADNISRLIEKAGKELTRTTGLELSSVLGINKEGEGWSISMEMVEKHSIPDQMDILATYEAVLDGYGNLVEFKRRGLRRRMDTQEQ